MKETKVGIDDILNGYDDFEKLTKIYEEIISLGLAKITEQNTPLITIHKPNWRGAPYKWELFVFGESLVIIEVYFLDGAYSMHYSLPPKIGGEVKNIRYLQYRILGPSDDADNVLEHIRLVMRKYPHHKSKSYKGELNFYKKYDCCPICGARKEKGGFRFYGEWKNGKCPNCGRNFKSAKTIAPQLNAEVKLQLFLYENTAIQSS